jgi:uncharacterized protein YxeA
MQHIIIIIIIIIIAMVASIFFRHARVTRFAADITKRYSKE